MKRRNFVAGAAAAPVLSMQAQDKPLSIYEFRYYHLRNTLDNQRTRLTDFLVKSALPAMQKAGAGPVGLFTSSLGPDTPLMLMIASYPGLAGFEQARTKILSNQEFMKAATEFYNAPGLPYQRVESQLIQAFQSMPQIEVPPVAEGKPPRLFELRTYESNTPVSLRKKIGMFENGEIAIFRKTGLNPVLFGESIVGRNMPNLTYMLWHDNLAAREANWRNFATSAEWRALSKTPGLSDGEVVSNISTVLLSPVNGSPIR